MGIFFKRLFASIVMVVVLISPALAVGSGAYRLEVPDAADEPAHVFNSTRWRTECKEQGAYKLFLRRHRQNGLSGPRLKADLIIR